jgi:NADH-quinone oxidoreductase subunit L
VIDWRFWHDFVHDTVILGTYNWLSEIALNEYADQKGIDAFANWLGTATQSVSATLRKSKMVSCVRMRSRFVGRRLDFRLSHI